MAAGSSVGRRGQHVAKVTVPSRGVAEPTTAAWLSGSDIPHRWKRSLRVVTRANAAWLSTPGARHFFFGSSRFFFRFLVAGLIVRDRLLDQRLPEDHPAPPTSGIDIRWSLTNAAAEIMPLRKGSPRFWIGTHDAWRGVQGVGGSRPGTASGRRRCCACPAGSRPPSPAKAGAGEESASSASTIRAVTSSRSGFGWASGSSSDALSLSSCQSHRIVKALEADLLPWARPWRATVERLPAGQAQQRRLPEAVPGREPPTPSNSTPCVMGSIQNLGTLSAMACLGCRICHRSPDVDPGSWGCRVVFWKPLIKKTVADDETRDEEAKRNGRNRRRNECPGSGQPSRVCPRHHAK